MLLFLSSCSPLAPTEAGTATTNLNNDTLYFRGAYQKGVPIEATFLLRNRGEGPAFVESMDITDDPSANFKLHKSPSLPFVLRPASVQEGEKITLRFSPATLKSWNAKLRIKYKRTEHAESSLELLVHLRFELDVALSWSCGGLIEFGAVVLGEKVEKECTLKNRGSHPLLLQGVRYVAEKGGKSLDFKWLSPSFPLSLASTESVRIKIVYKPTDLAPVEDLGAFVLEANLTHDAMGKLPQLKVKGTTGLPELQLTPLYQSCQRQQECVLIHPTLRCEKGPLWKGMQCTSPTSSILYFSFTTKGNTSQRSLLLRNTGLAPLEVKSIRFDQASAPAFQLAKPLQSLTIAPQGEVRLEILYSPTDPLAKSAFLIVESNASTPTLRLELRGLKQGCDLDVQPRKVDFTTHSPASLTISNRGDEPCLVAQLKFTSKTPHSFSLVPHPQETITLPAKAMRTYQIHFRPLRQGDYKDTLQVVSNDADEPQISVPLAGLAKTAPPCVLSLDSLQVDFGESEAGALRKRQLQLTNIGGGECDISKLTVANVSPSGSKAFVLLNPPQLPYKLQASSAMAITLGFQASRGAVPFTGSLEIQSNDVSRPTWSVPLAGRYTACLVPLSVHIDRAGLFGFGASQLGCATTRVLNLFNPGKPGCSKSLGIEKIEWSNPNGEFSIKSKLLLPRSFSVGHSLRLELVYKPLVVGQDKASLSISGNGTTFLSIPVSGEGVTTSQQIEVHYQEPEPKVDFLFVIANSPSMAEESKSIPGHLETLLKWLSTKKVDYHIMVTTADSTATLGCARGTSPIITKALTWPVEELRANANVGTSGTGKSQGLEAAYKALSEPARSGCNKGFYRSEAALSLVFISDNTDHSPQTVQFFVAFFKSLKGPQYLHKLRATSIVGPLPSGCRNAGVGAALGAPRYIQVTKDLGGSAESICDPKWSTSLLSAAFAIHERTQFVLKRPADPKSIRVKVNGLLAKQDPRDGWQFEPKDNSVHFARAHMPPPGAQIEIVYIATCLP